MDTMKQVYDKQQQTMPLTSAPPINNASDMKQFVIAKLMQKEDSETGFVPSKCLSQEERTDGKLYPVGRRKPGCLDLIYNGIQLYNVIESFPTSLLQASVNDDTYLVNLMGKPLNELEEIEGLEGMSTFTAIPLSIAHKKLLPKKIAVPGNEVDKQYIKPEDVAADKTIDGEVAMVMKDMIEPGSVSLVAPQDLRKDKDSDEQSLMSQARVTIYHNAAEIADKDGYGISISGGVIHVNGKLKISGRINAPCPTTGLPVKDNPFSAVLPSTVLTPLPAKFPNEDMTNMIKTLNNIRKIVTA